MPVCGTVHATNKAAVEYGCMVGIPEKRFQLDQLVWVKFLVSKGMEILGEVRGQGRVVGVERPALQKPVQEGVGPQLQRLGGYNKHQIAFTSPTQPHDWLVTVEPLNAGSEKKGYVARRALPQSEVELVSEVAK